ncbi:hypothetical protein [Oryza sativa Japonica Group]|uniref:Uncharacterized protein n=1 Tax=Oryza sativa subsp. japonica TaxID=39947 RepID=A2ZZ75_ORYSJ|nr:hypothetical protein OsJ_03948 [Oryza sativa Japonica Group]BAB68114.1 hypothetical protein [Oryza sativa Japonica Group]BAB89582.1 hypothetical protein [Oryza sativa Japonica Group]
MNTLQCCWLAALPFELVTNSSAFRLEKDCLVLRCALVLLIVASSEVWSVQGEDCWNVDNVRYLVCTHTHKCRETCQDHGNVDGRCKWGCSHLWPICECLPPNFQ